MEQFIVRMNREKDDLEGKIRKAKKMFSVDGINKLDEVEQKLLKEQIKFMECYLRVLNDRIRYETK